MGLLYRFDYIEEGIADPIVLSFRLSVEITEDLYNKFVEYLDPYEAPANCFLSQLYVRKIDQVFYLFITVNLTSFYEEWASEPFNYSYKDIVNLLREKICKRFGKKFTQTYICHEKLDCDFIEYTFITRGRDVTRDMQECYAPGDQVSKTCWEDYLESCKEQKKFEKSTYVKDKDGNQIKVIDFLVCCIDDNYSDYAKKIDTNSNEGYNMYHEYFYEAYVRCNGTQLQNFFDVFDKIDYIGRRGVLLKYLFDSNFKRTLCQCAYEDSCMRRGSTERNVKLLYEECCKEFGNLLESQDDEYYELDERETPLFSLDEK